MTGSASFAEVHQFVVNQASCLTTPTQSTFFEFSFQVFCQTALAPPLVGSLLPNEKQA